MTDIENINIEKMDDELKSLLKPLIKSYPILKFDCVLEWINFIFDNYIEIGGSREIRYLSDYSRAVQLFCNFHFTKPNDLLEEDFKTRIKRIKDFRESFKNESTYYSYVNRVNFFYSYYGLLTKRPKPKMFIKNKVEKPDQELVKRYLGERKDRLSILRKKIEFDVSLMEFNDFFPYLKDFFVSKNYFSIKIFIKYLLTYVLGIDSGNGNYEKYLKKLSYKFIHISENLQNQGFIEPYDNESFKILNKNIKKIETSSL